MSLAKFIPVISLRCSECGQTISVNGLFDDLVEAALLHKCPPKQPTRKRVN